MWLLRNYYVSAQAYYTHNKTVFQQINWWGENYSRFLQAKSPSCCPPNGINAIKIQTWLTVNWQSSPPIMTGVRYTLAPKESVPWSNSIAADKFRSNWGIFHHFQFGCSLS